MNLLSSTEKPTRINPGPYSQDFVFSSVGFSTTENPTGASLAVVDGGVRRQLYFEPDSCYTFIITFSFSASGGTNFAHGGSVLFVVWTNRAGVPTVMTNTPILATYNGIVASTVFDPRVNKHRLNISGYMWSNQVTHWLAVVNTVAVVRS